MTRNEEIVGLRNSGLTPRQVAERLGITRNAVIGACYRAGACRKGLDPKQVQSLYGVRGEEIGTAVLTENQVRQIRNLFEPHSPQFGAGALSRQFCVSDSTIRDVIHRRSWAHIA